MKLQANALRSRAKLLMKKKKKSQFVSGRRLDKVYLFLILDVISSLFELDLQ